MNPGDNFFTCSNKELLEHVLRQMIYVDENGKPVLHTNSAGTDLEPYFTCQNASLSLEQVFREMILVDENNKPYLNTTS